MSVKQLDDLLSEYGASHRHPTNKLFHWICVPAIYFSIVGLLMAIPTPFAKHWWFNWASVALFVGLIYYFKLSWKIAVFFTVWNIFVLLGNWMIYKHFYWNGSKLAFLSIVVFTVAWIGQFLGHQIEGKKPSFFKDLQFLLIGPAWLAQFIFPGLAK